MSIFEDHKERIITGLALVAGVLLIGLIDNFFLMWLFFGAVYILAFKEAMNLFQIENEKRKAISPWSMVLDYWIINISNYFFLSPPREFSTYFR